MIGSTWRKWDLHFHSQSSYDYKDKSTTDQEIIDGLVSSGVEVVAITDHHVIDTVRIRNLQRIGKGKITILPGIEFRAELGGSESIHFIGIFSEESNVEDIWIKIQSGCSITAADIEKKGGDQYIHCDFKDTCKLIHDLGGIVTVHAGEKTNTIENITNTLPYKMALKTDLVINHIDILELGKVDDQDDYNKIVFPAINFRLPMIICSDNHEIKKYTVKANLWLKAEPTFEGLKQIIYEPIYRVHIGDQAPLYPPIKINKVLLDFPVDSTFEGEPFCFSGKTSIEFSPNFTCIIGGRGVGKSTVLNLIHEKFRPGRNDFFKNRKIKDRDDKAIPFEGTVNIENSDESTADFLSQNEVEDFAKDNAKLTSAIYTRILARDFNRNILDAEKDIVLFSKNFDEVIQKRRRLNSILESIEQTRRSLQSKKSIIEFYESQRYNSLVKKIQEFTHEINQIESSKERYIEILGSLTKLGMTAQIEKPSENDYQKRIDLILEKIKGIWLEEATVDFRVIENARIGVLNSRDLLTTELREYLKNQGLTPENLKDVSEANVEMSRLSSFIDLQNSTVKALEQEINAFSSGEFLRKIAQYRKAIESQITSINSQLEDVNNKFVNTISLELDFDQELARNTIYEEFYSHFKKEIDDAKSALKFDYSYLKDILVKGELHKVDVKEIFMKTVKDLPTKSTAKNFLLDFLENHNTYETFKLIVDKNINDYVKYKLIRVYYAKRELEKTSFGQRCTAALVILIMLGNNPIIIDEPEAHLDSLLISNFLVGVIKELKKSRQIIFATHNANFVINGDAELIHILNSTETNKTSIRSTTIENKETREFLVALEGGSEALKIRESRYSGRIK